MVSRRKINIQLATQRSPTTVRFCKQRDNYSCGAIAMLNIAKFQRYHVTYHDLKYYQNLVGCRKECGTFTRRITKVLGRASRRSWKVSREFLHAGNCILIFTGRDGHFYLITTDENGCFITVNRYRGIGCPSTFQILPHAVARLLKCAKLTWYVEKGTRLL